MTGKNVGVLAQIHFYLDDIAPKIFTWTPFHGVLGPDPASVDVRALRAVAVLAGRRGAGLGARVPGSFRAAGRPRRWTPRPAVRIWFDGAIEPVFSTLRVEDADKRRVDRERRARDATDRTLLEVSLPPLAARPVSGLLERRGPGRPPYRRQLRVPGQVTAQSRRLARPLDRVRRAGRPGRRLRDRPVRPARAGPRRLAVVRGRLRDPAGRLHYAPAPRDGRRSCGCGPPR